MATTQRSTQSVTMTVERTLLSRAREAGINLSATLTAALDAELRQYEAKKWQEENWKLLIVFTMNMVVSAMSTGHFKNAVHCIQ
ncbi:type II toxin-antitoxin system CcdA family antitoxin [Salmonella enterica]|uniref:type II toxin-antitoxin system CcdA family antitoxin n=1 Tax=Salmonella enterica TaxID=28901 RepID=UPI0021B2DA18|nr:type II toxin-antitoxin system CcdA family antitoxin [Salmonella enterica]MCT7066738.1 type II toxin-antitoxin system CcdA family antitoxin [Salmonella enterica subsp. enterica serovar Soahanina]